MYVLFGLGVFTTVSAEQSGSSVIFKAYEADFLKATWTVGSLPTTATWPSGSPPAGSLFGGSTSTGLSVMCDGGVSSGALHHVWWVTRNSALNYTFHSQCARLLISLTLCSSCPERGTPSYPWTSAVYNLANGDSFTAGGSAVGNDFNSGWGDFLVVAEPAGGTVSRSPSPEVTASSVPSPIRTASPSPEVTASPVPSPIATASPSPEVTASPVPSPIATTSLSPEVTASPAPSPFATASPSPSYLFKGTDAFGGVSTLPGSAAAVVTKGAVQETQRHVTGDACSMVAPTNELQTGQIDRLSSPPLGSVGEETEAEAPSGALWRTKDNPTHLMQQTELLGGSGGFTGTGDVSLSVDPQPTGFGPSRRMFDSYAAPKPLPQSSTFHPRKPVHPSTTVPNRNGLAVGPLVGLIVGAIALALLALCLILFLVSRRGSDSSAKVTPQIRSDPECPGVIDVTESCFITNENPMNTEESVEDTLEGSRGIGFVLE